MTRQTATKIMKAHRDLQAAERAVRFARPDTPAEQLEVLRDAESAAEVALVALLDQCRENVPSVMDSHVVVRFTKHEGTWHISWSFLDPRR